MATNHSLIEFTGQLGGFIGYRRNGKYCIRTAPQTVRQTQSTRRAAQWFGAASRKSALIRSAVAPDLDIIPDGAHVNRLNRTIIKAGRNNHGGLAGFRFNPHTSVENFFASGMEFRADGKLHIPAQDLLVDKKFVRMEIKLIGTRIDFPTQQVTGTDATALYIDLKHPYPYFGGAELPIHVPGKGTLLVTVQVRLFLEENVSHNRKFKAADIIAVVEETQLMAVPLKSTPYLQAHQLQPLPPGNPAPGAYGQTCIQRE